MSETEHSAPDNEAERAEVFWEGGRQTVRLPAGMTIDPGVAGAVRVRREGAALVLEPSVSFGRDRASAEVLGWPPGYFEALDAGAADSTIEAPDRPSPDADRDAVLKGW